MFSYFEMKKYFEDNGCKVYDVLSYKDIIGFYIEKNNREFLTTKFESFCGVYDKNKKEIVFCCKQKNEMIVWIANNYDTSSFDVELSKECIRGGKSNNIIGEYHNTININQSNVKGDNIITPHYIGQNLKNNIKTYYINY